MAILFPVKREMAILFFVKRDLDPPLPPSGQCRGTMQVRYPCRRICVKLSIKAE